MVSRDDVKARNTKWDYIPEYGKSRVLWSELSNGMTVILYQLHHGDKGSDGEEVFLKHPDLPKYVVVVRKIGVPRALFHIELNDLTGEDLYAIKELFGALETVAGPVIAEYDLRAKLEHEDGIDTDPRMYRRVPRLFTRPRKSPEHRESIRDRSETVPEQLG